MPTDFEFYQKKPFWQQGDELRNNRLHGALTFNESDTLVQSSNVALPMASESELLDNITFEFCIKVNENETRGNNAYLFTFQAGSRKISVRNPQAISIGDGCHTFNDTNVSLLDNRWHHLAFVFQQGKPILFYLDTELVYTSTLNYDGGNPDSGYKIPSIGDFYLGNNSSSNSSYYLDNSLIRNVRIWGKACSQAEIILNAGGALGFNDRSSLGLY